jgi:hypothetical protein
MVSWERSKLSDDGEAIPISRTVPGGVAALTAEPGRENAYFQPGIAMVASGRIRTGAHPTEKKK